MLGLYIHIPFCIKKCNYCNFVSVPAKENAQQVDAYIDALVKEIELTGNMYEKTVDSIFIGGGTPSLLDVKQLNKIMTALQKYYKIFGNCEITLESNPCSLDIKKLKAYREMGINRLSIGLQAAQDEHLAALGRQHTVQGFDTAFSNARKAGFENINVDMIYALPNQTMKELAQTVQHILSKKPEHISAYALKIEKGTPFYRLLQDEKIVQVDEDTDVEMYHKVQEMLCECGYTNYEISNFAYTDCECRHNLKYWNLKDYLGLGIAAHSCIDRLRFANTSDMSEYLENMRTGELNYPIFDFISDSNRKIEYIMLKLRLKKGFTFYDYQNKFHEDFLETHEEEMKKVLEYDLAKVVDASLMPTAKGFDLQNQLVAILIDKM